MAYAVLDKTLAKEATKKEAFLGRLIIKKEYLRVMEKDFVVIPWNKWLKVKEEEG